MYSDDLKLGSWVLKNFVHFGNKLFCYWVELALIIRIVGEAAERVLRECRRSGIHSVRYCGTLLCKHLQNKIMLCASLRVSNVWKPVSFNNKKLDVNLFAPAIMRKTSF